MAHFNIPLSSPQESPSRYPCGDCQDIFNNPRSLNQHKYAHGPNFPCPWCPGSFTVESTYERHMTRVHPIPITTTKRHKCFICQVLFHSSQDLLKHRKIEHIQNCKSFTGINFQILNVILM